MTNKLLEEFNAYFTSANDVEVSVPVAEWRKLYDSLTALKLPFPAWREGDILRVIHLEPGDETHYSLGQLVRHDDCDGDSCPCLKYMSGTPINLCAHAWQLEFVERPE